MEGFVIENTLRKGEVVVARFKWDERDLRKGKGKGKPTQSTITT